MWINSRVAKARGVLGLFQLKSPRLPHQPKRNYGKRLSTDSSSTSATAASMMARRPPATLRCTNSAIPTNRAGLSTIDWKERRIRDSKIQGCDGHGNLNAHIVCAYNNQPAGFPKRTARDITMTSGLPVRQGRLLGDFRSGQFHQSKYANLMSEAYNDGAPNQQ